jgi:putative transport protein
VIQLLHENPVLLLFLVAASGYLVGQIKIGGFSLGMAAVLFVGLAFGALAPELRLPDFVYLFGLVLFVYSIALAGGPGFVASFRRKGLHYNLLVGGVLLLAMLLTFLLGTLLSLSPPLRAGLFAGALTNTPALAAALEALKHSESLQSLPVTAYAVAYPVGVIGMLLAFQVAWRWWGQPSQEGSKPQLLSRTLEVSQPAVLDQTLAQIQQQHGWKVVFGRLERSGVQQTANPHILLQAGDRLNVVGTAQAVDQAIAAMGKPVQVALEEDHHILDFKRVFVSRRQVAGRTLAELNLTGRFGVVLTRIQRGDVEFLPSHDTSLELGDRVRVVGPKENIAEVSRYLGDSYRALSEIDVVSFSLGIALGLLLGSVPIPLGGASFKLGFAGGPLLVGLLLGALGRTGPLVWQMPYSASLTIRQLGLILFLAGIGIRSGGAFAQTLMGGDGWRLLVAGAMLTLSTALLILWVGHRLLKVPLPVLGGMLAGAQTQPAVLAFVLEKTQRDEPNQGYTSVYPLAMLLKIVMVQLLLR